MAMAVDSYCEWRGIVSGQPIPENAVQAGKTAADGEIWVGRINGQAGKITVTNAGMTADHKVIRKMNRFRHHADGTWRGFENAEILCCTGVPRWLLIKRGELIPPNAVKAGETPSDGVTYVGRSVDDWEPGKINLSNGTMHNFWCHGHYWTCQQEAQVLVVEAGQPVATLPQHAAPTPAVTTPVAVPSQGGAAVATPAPAASTPTPAALPVVQRPQYKDERLPDAPANFPELARLSEDELAYLRANPLALDDWLLGLPDVKRHAARAQKLREENADVAHRVLAKESQYTSLALSSERGTEALRQQQSSVQALLVKRDEVLQQQSPERLAQALQVRAQNSDAVAEDCLQQSHTVPGQMESSALAELRQQYIRQKAEKHTRLALHANLTTSGR